MSNTSYAMEYLFLEFIQNEEDMHVHKACMACSVLCVLFVFM